MNVQRVPNAFINANLLDTAYYASPLCHWFTRSGGTIDWENCHMIVIDNAVNLWRNRGMLAAIVSRNFRGKYRNSKLGVLWQFITPIISIILYYAVFDAGLKVARMDEYWLFLCMGVYPYSVLRGAMIGGCTAVTSQAGMVKKMKIPREILPVSSVCTDMIVFSISFVFVIIIAALSGHNISGECLPVTIVVALLMMMFCIGVTMLLSSVCVYVRDLGHLINSFGRLLFWVTPIFYDVYSLSGTMSSLIWCNPLTYYIVSFRNLIFDATMPSTSIMLMCIALSISLLVIGTYVFAKLERGFAERL